MSDLRVQVVEEAIAAEVGVFLEERKHGRVLVIAVMDQEDGQIGWVQTTTSQELFETRSWRAAVVIHSDLLDAVRSANERRTG